MSTIVDTQTTTDTVVIQQAVSTTEFVVKQIHENVEQNWVRAEIELGPFTTEERPDGSTETRGSSRRSVVIWQDADYLAVRDIWNNIDLLAVLPTKL